MKRTSRGRAMDFRVGGNTRPPAPRLCKYSQTLVLGGGCRLVGVRGRPPGGKGVKSAVDGWGQAPTTCIELFGGHGGVDLSADPYDTPIGHSSPATFSRDCRSGSAKPTMEEGLTAPPATHPLQKLVLRVALAQLYHLGNFRRRGARGSAVGGA